MIKRFEGHARGHRAVAYDGNGVAVLRTSLLAFSGHHAERGADRGARMTYAEGVVFAFAARWKGGEAVWLPHAEHTLTSPCQNFVRIGLVSYIPNKAVVRRVKDIM